MNRKNLKLPGEMILIKAGAYEWIRAAAPDLANGTIDLNKVVTRNNDIYGVKANQPAVARPRSLHCMTRSTKIALLNYS